MLQIDTHNAIIIDGRSIGLSIVQRGERSVVFTPENRLSGRLYREHKMPHERYSTAHDAPTSGAAGRAQLEVDVMTLINRALI